MRSGQYGRVQFVRSPRHLCRCASAMLRSTHPGAKHCAIFARQVRPHEMGGDVRRRILGANVKAHPRLSLRIRADQRHWVERNVGASLVILVGGDGRIRKRYPKFVNRLLNGGFHSSAPKNCRRSRAQRKRTLRAGTSSPSRTRRVFRFANASLRMKSSWIGTRAAMKRSEGL